MAEAQSSFSGSKVGKPRRESSRVIPAAIIPPFTTMRSKVSDATASWSVFIGIGVISATV